MNERRTAKPSASGWTFAGTPSSLGLHDGTVTLVEGAAFCISGSDGDIDRGMAHGLFFRDTRLLSGWQLLVDGEPPELLSHIAGEPFAARFISRARPRDGRADSTVLVLRERYIGHGMREDVAVRNLGSQPLTCTVSVTVEADCANLFEVKESRVRPRGEHAIVVDTGSMRLERHWRGKSGGTRVQAVGWSMLPSGVATIDITVAPRSEWRSSLQVQPWADGVAGITAYPSDQPVEHTEPSRRLQQWRRDIPVVRTGDVAFSRMLARTEEDLGALRIIDPQHPDRIAVAAGAPWFMTVFGRDSLVTAWMALPLDQTLAIGTLHTLAALQGQAVSDRTDEEPGRIMHEIRHGMDTARSSERATVYYGSIDATPLFVMLLGELYRWGAPPDALEMMRPAADKAITWIEEYGDRDGDGFVEYERRSSRGLVNQGWKDSFDGITFADGRIAEPPIALAEVQGYAYAAYLAHAEMAERSGDTSTAGRDRKRAAALRLAFNRDFWLADRGYFALALDADKRPVDGLGSNIGHCLWTGIVDDDKAALVAERLLQPDMFTGWGIRTLAASMGAYNPMSYHNGSVWPHDTAIAVAGLMRYGHTEEAHRVVRGLVAAGAAFGGRLPELFCGFDRAEFEAPVVYPTSCSPQAWAAASPLLLLRSLLRLDPAVPEGRVWLAPALPAALEDLTLDQVPLAGSRIGISVAGGDGRITGLPTQLTLAPEPRPVHFDDTDLG